MRLKSVPLAFCLNFFFPGAGYIYAGMYSAGIATFIVALFFLILFFPLAMLCAFIAACSVAMHVSNHNQNVILEQSNRNTTAVIRALTRSKQSEEIDRESYREFYGNPDK